jgi:hypothetical protein
MLRPMQRDGVAAMTAELSTEYCRVRVVHRIDGAAVLVGTVVVAERLRRTIAERLRQRLALCDLDSHSREVGDDVVDV